LVDGLIRSAVVRKGHESKTSGSPGVAVRHHPAVFYLAEPLEGGA
jgi:hypothetical protein